MQRSMQSIYEKQIITIFGILQINQAEYRLNLQQKHVLHNVVINK